MADRSAAPANPETQYVDQVFGTLAYTSQSAAPSVAPIFQPTSPTALPCQTTDLTAEYQWLREERKRIEGYTLHQFAAINQQREELLARRGEVEAQFLLREQELNRKTKLLADRTDAVAIREKQLSEAETAFMVHKEDLSRAEQQLQQHQQTSAKLQKEIEMQRLTYEQVRFQTTQLQETARAAQAELEAFERMLQSRKAESEKDHGRFTHRLERLEQRERELARAEESMRRREAEHDQLEAQLRCEIEERERQLALEQREITELRARLRQHADDASRPDEIVTETPRLNALVTRPTLAIKPRASKASARDTVHG